MINQINGGGPNPIETEICPTPPISAYCPRPDQIPTAKTCLIHTAPVTVYNC